jgi:hypothetical protein
MNVSIARPSARVSMALRKARVPDCDPTRRVRASDVRPRQRRLTRGLTVEGRCFSLRLPVPAWLTVGRAAGALGWDPPLEPVGTALDELGLPATPKLP